MFADLNQPCHYSLIFKGFVYIIEKKVIAWDGLVFHSDFRLFDKSLNFFLGDSWVTVIVLITLRSSRLKTVLVRGCWLPITPHHERSSLVGTSSQSQQLCMRMCVKAYLLKSCFCSILDNSLDSKFLGIFVCILVVHCICPVGVF